jgi:hypothetical protein
MKHSTWKMSQTTLDQMYKTITDNGIKLDESTDSAGVHLEYWLYNEQDCAIVRTDEAVNAIYNHDNNKMYITQF